MRYTRNLSNVISNLRIESTAFQNKIKSLVEVAGRNAEHEAKTNAPVDLGKHRQNIVYEPTKRGFGARLTANMPYAAYLEFGTGTSVDIPAGFEELAEKFKGKGVRQINLPPRPHIIPAAIRAYEQLKRDIERIL